MRELNDEQFERYARHLILDEVGEKGQDKLLSARVLCVGAGGLGSPASMYLAAAGVGTIGLIDDDIVDLSNLQRQIIHATSKIGVPKVESAQETLSRVNPTIKIRTYKNRITAGNITEIINEYDVIVDGSDNFETRYLINDAAFLNRKIVVSGALLRFEGQLTTFRSGLEFNEGEPCYRCLFPKAPPANSSNRCEDVGILGSVAGVIGTLQATEVIKEIIGLGETMSGRLLIFDAMNMEFRKIRYKKRLDCRLCGDDPSITEIN